MYTNQQRRKYLMQHCCASPPARGKRKINNSAAPFSLSSQRRRGKEGFFLVYGGKGNGCMGERKRRIAGLVVQYMHSISVRSCEDRMGKMGLPPLSPPPFPLSMHHCTPLPNMHTHKEGDSYCTTIAITYVAGTAAGNRIYVRLVQNGIFFPCAKL